MSSTNLRDIGRRIELVSMDSHFYDISLGLYERETDGMFLVHTYSNREGATERVRFVVAAMAVLGGMTVSNEGGAAVGFPCGHAHRLAARRIFLEAAKLPTGSVLEAKPLAIFDKKTQQTIRVMSHSEGEYLVRSDGDEGEHDRRAAVAALGLVRLGEMDPITETSDRIRFGCGVSHDAAVGLLLTRALNVRAAMREIEEQASRGVLAAPSAQAD